MGKEIEKRGRMTLERRRTLQARFLQFMLESGKLDYREAAKAIVKNDDKYNHKARVWMRRYRRWIETDEEFQKLVGQMCMGQLRGALPETVAALNRRAAKGNVPAQKLAMEASGFYSPRTTHEHTGDIAITLKGLTRPAAVEDDPVVDATVVDD
jgi:hypothetical protein